MNNKYKSYEEFEQAIREFTLKEYPKAKEHLDWLEETIDDMRDGMQDGYNSGRTKDCDVSGWAFAVWQAM